MYNEKRGSENTHTHTHIGLLSLVKCSVSREKYDLKQEMHAVHRNIKTFDIYKSVIIIKKIADFI